VRRDKPEAVNRELVVEDILPEVNKGLEFRNNKSGDYSEEETNTSEEQNKINSIDGSTNNPELAARWWDLNHGSRFREPLVGDLGARIHIFKARDNGKDIVEMLTATVLPQRIISEKVALRFGITLDDLFVASVPMKQDPKKVLICSLERLEKFMTNSLPQTEWYSANLHAVELLKESGAWEWTPVERAIEGT